MAGLGTTGALVAAIACAFTVLSAVVAVRGWSGTLADPPVQTLDGGALALGDPLAGLSGGATGAVGQVAGGTGTTVDGLLGGLGRTSAR